MAIRYDTQTKTGDLDVVDNEGRGHRVRFGGAGTGNRVKTDVTFEFDSTCPDQLGLQCPSVAQGDLTFDQTAVTYTSNAVDVKLYVRPGDTLRPSDFQFDAILKTRAAANAAASFQLQLTNYQNFDFIYITPFVPVYEEIKRGQPWVYNYDRAQYLIDPSSVPEPPGGYIGRQKWHNGGYHVKHKTWKNHRQSSTYCHICVPRLTDALSNESWGTINVNPATGIITYSNDATFLASQALPITLDPTFGDTTAGTDTFPMSNGRALLSLFTLGEAANVTDIYIYCDDNGFTTPIKGLVYTNSGGNANTQEVLTTGGTVPTTPSWYQLSVTDTLTAGDYHIGSITDGYSNWYKDSSGGNDTKRYEDNYTTPSATFPSPAASYGGQINAYVEYTSGGGGGGGTKPCFTALTGAGQL